MILPKIKHYYVQHKVDFNGWSKGKRCKTRNVSIGHGCPAKCAMFL